MPVGIPTEVLRTVALSIAVTVAATVPAYIMSPIDTLLSKKEASPSVNLFAVPAVVTPVAETAATFGMFIVLLGITAKALPACNFDMPLLLIFIVGEDPV